MSDQESMEFDVVIVGGGPAGLCAAIRLKQLKETCSVVILEKGSEIGAHILSGAVVDPIALNSLLPDWQEDPDCPLKNPVTKDSFYMLGASGGARLPNFLMPKLMHNEGCHAVSLGDVSRWLAQKAENLGVEIYPGFAAAGLIKNDEGAVIGVEAGALGIGKDGEQTANYTPPMALKGKYVLIGEGARGSLAKHIIADFQLDKDCDPQKYGLGFKELWQIDPDKHHEGHIMHSFGWPLDNKTGGGSFIYHLKDNQVSLGFVVHLNYENPHLSPFEEFQRFKTHPMIAELLEGGKRLSYGARAITEGGWQSVPRVDFPGGALMGCSAGFVNVPRIKGSHNAMLSGMLTAEHVSTALEKGRAHDRLEELDQAWRTSSIGKDLKPVRNVKPLWSKYGTRLGVMLGGFDMWMQSLFGRSFFGTLSHGKADHECLKPAKTCKKITYPKPDGKLSFDKLSSVFLSNTNHEENQPIHLKVKDLELQKQSELDVYGGPSERYCPAGVYEWVKGEQGEDEFVINAQNCVHCKTCDIKDPNQNINWTVPEGSGGPNYPNM